MAPLSSPTDRICAVIAKNSTISNVTARTLAWMGGVAVLSGGFPIEISPTQISEGFEHRGVSIPGTGSRLQVIRESLEWLEDQAIISVEEGRRLNYAGHRARVVSLL